MLCKYELLFIGIGLFAALFDGGRAIALLVLSVLFSIFVQFSLFPTGYSLLAGCAHGRSYPHAPSNRLRRQPVIR